VAMQAGLPYAEVEDELLISVVMPTRDRRELLEEAVASVEAQSYANWELVVVDDGSTDETADFLAGIEDDRVRALRTDGVGVCAARNLALDAANGDLIAYLDDDNRFDSHWLKAVALSFNAHPEGRVCYGARVFDDEGRVTNGEGNGLSALQFVKWDPEAIREHNFLDMNVLAHRRGPVRFDESLSQLGDWDLLLRLTRDADPIEVPAIAVYYRSDVERMSTTISSQELEREYGHVRRKLAEAALR
jgi:glycosyltransferase involved in cell wall biosynthesis